MRGEGEGSALSVTSSARGWLIFALGSSLCLTAQIASFEVQEETIVIEEKSGLRHYLLAEGMDVRSIRISPDGARLIYHLGLAWTSSGQRIPVRLWSPADRYKVKEYEVPTCSRFVDTVEWVDSRLVLIAGDRCGVVVDTADGKLLHKILGSRLAVSPDRNTIAFLEFHPNGTPDYVPDEVHLLWLAPGKMPAGGNVEKIDDRTLRIFPPDPRQILLKAYEDKKPAPGIESGFLWFSDNRLLAFVESHLGKRWLVLLHLNMAGDTLTADHQRLELPVPADEPLTREPRLQWTQQDRQVTYATGSRTVTVNLPWTSTEPHPER